MDYRQMRADFRARLEKAGRRIGFTVDQRKETRLALSGALKCLIYFKTSSQPPPSASTADWGVTKNYIEQFGKSRISWVLVLLQGSAHSGYFLTPSQVKRHVREDIWPLARDGDYKVARKKLRYATPFESFNVFLRLLLDKIGQGQAKAGGEIPSRARETLSETDFLKREAQRIETGRRGEEYVVEVESEALRKSGRKVLAGKVERVSTYDVFAGYDVLSFYPDGREKYIEVKTSLERMSTFEITANEVQVARELADAYWLYLVEGLEDNPKVRPIQNPSQKFGKEILLEASVYTARLS